MHYFTNIGRAEPTPPWGVSAVLFTLVAAFAAVIVGTSLVTVILPDANARFVIGYLVAAALTVIFVMVTRGRTPQERDALAYDKRTRTPLILVFMLAIGVAILIDLIGLPIAGVFLPTPELFGFYDITQNPVVAAPLNMLDWAFALLLLVIAQPIAEELVFRGVTYPALNKALGAWSGYLFTSVFYAVFHLVAYAPQGGTSGALFWYTLILPFLESLFVTGVRANTRSTRAAIAAHAGLGLFALLRAFVIA